MWSQEAQPRLAKALLEPVILALLSLAWYNFSAPAAMATLTASTCIYRQTRVAETHIELAKYQQREGKFSDAHAVVLATAKTMAPASWGALYGKHVPLLKAVACSVLAQPVSASAAERNWSVYGRMRGVYHEFMRHDACAEPHAPRAR